jgi:hypothetical protein
MVLDAYIYYQNGLHKFTIKIRRYIFYATIDDHNYFTCFRFSLMYTSCKFMSCTNKLITNSLTNSCLYTCMIENKKYHLMCFLSIHSMFQSKKQTCGQARQICFLDWKSAIIVCNTEIAIAYLHPLHSSNNKFPTIMTLKINKDNSICLKCFYFFNS